MFRFLKTWTLPLAILTGALAYAVYHLCPCFDLTRPYAAPIVSVVQPVLIFSMLFLSFCKVSPQLRLRRVHFVHLLFQCGLFAAGSLLLHFFPSTWFDYHRECHALLDCPSHRSRRRDAKVRG
ncbi:MAG: hypothetical protein ACLS29_03455 [Prevotellamassilia sp.]